MIFLFREKTRSLVALSIARKPVLVMSIIAIVMAAFYFVLGFLDHEFLRFVFKVKIDQIKISGVVSQREMELIAVTSSLSFFVAAPYLIYVSIYECIPYGAPGGSFVKQSLLSKAVIGLFLLVAVTLSVVVFPYSSSLPVDFFFQGFIRYSLANVLLIWVFAYVLLLEASLAKDLIRDVKGKKSID